MRADLPAGLGRSYVDWMAAKALPLWSTMGWNVGGACFFEALTFDGTPDRTVPLRIRTLARQIYVYSHAHVLGIGPDGLDLAHAGLMSLRERAWAPDGRPGWVHSLSLDGGLANPLRDAYDHAFVLNALAWFHRATGERFALDWADETLHFMDTGLAAPVGGWSEDDAGTLPRRQNPHMHAFEALLALYEATGDAVYLGRASELFGLMRGRFYDEEQGLLWEFFDPLWNRLPGEEGDALEPGHMMEWVWLLRRYEKACGRPVAALCAPLLTNARRLGLDEASGFLWDVVGPAGVPADPTRRLWVQCEYAKALIVEYRAGGPAALADEAQGVLDRVLSSYLADGPAGGWTDKYNSGGRPASRNMPASSLYHLLSVVAELV